MQRKTKSERAEARSFGQVFRDTATLLLLVLLAVSVRLDGNEGQAAVEPLPGGLQAAEVGEFAAPAEPAASPAVEFAVEPAVACPKSRPAAGPASRIIPASFLSEFASEVASELASEADLRSDEDLQLEVELRHEPREQRLLILHDGAVREIRVSAHIGMTTVSTACGEIQPRLVRS